MLIATCTCACRFYVNVQGDEPVIPPTDIAKLIEEAMKKPEVVHSEP